MNAGKLLFAQLMDFLPWTSFARSVARYGGDRRVRNLRITYDIFRTFDWSFILGGLVQAGGARPLRRERWSQPWKRDWSRQAG